MEYFRELIHGGDVSTYRERCDGGFIDFSANINPFGQPESVKKALESCSKACLYYPDQLCRELKAAISDYEGVPADWILCGNGAADIIYRIVLALKPKTALLPAPTFAEYAQALTLSGCSIRYYSLAAERGFALGEDILEALPGVDIVFLCNPNNPVGNLIDGGLLRRIVKAAGESGATLVVDECFLDFLPDGEEITLKNVLSDYKHLILLRSFTKMFAIPGVRLGYALLQDLALHRILENAAAPWSVSVPAQLCGIAATEEQRFAADTRLKIAQLREELFLGLAGLGLRVYPGCANYLFFSAREDLAERLCDAGIVIRDCGNYQGLKKGYFRAAVRTKMENDKLLAVLSEII